MKKTYDYVQSSACGPGDGAACLAGRHKPVPGGLTVAIRTTGTCETGGPIPFGPMGLRIGRKQRPRGGLRVGCRPHSGYLAPPLYTHRNAHYFVEQAGRLTAAPTTSKQRYAFTGTPFSSERASLQSQLQFGSLLEQTWSIYARMPFGYWKTRTFQGLSVSDVRPVNGYKQRIEQ
jgi:hypothetical protein